MEIINVGNRINNNSIIKLDKGYLLVDAGYLEQFGNLMKKAGIAERIMFMGDGKIVSEMRFSKFSGTDSEDRIKKVTVKMREIGI